MQIGFHSCKHVIRYLVEMHGSRHESVDELKQQILDLQRKLGDLHAGDVSVLKRQNRSLTQHTHSLKVEMHDMSRAATRLKQIRDELSGSACATEVARSIGVFWIGSVLTYWLKTSLKLGHKASGMMLLVTAVSAALPLGVNGCCKLRKVLTENPRAVDELLQALAILEQRVDIMCDLTRDPVTSSDMGTGNVSGNVSALNEREGVSALDSTDDIVHLVPSDWESPTAHHGAVTMNQTGFAMHPLLTTSQVRVLTENHLDCTATEGALCEAEKEPSVHFVSSDL